MGYNLLINGVYPGCNPVTNLLLPSWDIQVVYHSPVKKNKNKSPTFYLGVASRAT